MLHFAQFVALLTSTIAGFILSRCLPLQLFSSRQATLHKHLFSYFYTWMHFFEHNLKKTEVLTKYCQTLRSIAFLFSSLRSRLNGCNVIIIIIIIEWCIENYETCMYWRVLKRGMDKLLKVSLKMASTWCIAKVGFRPKTLGCPCSFVTSRLQPSPCHI